MEIYSTGSSPQVRGTRGKRFAALTTERFIPAGAGNTLMPMVHPNSTAVHPRRCGEHTGGNNAAKGSNGSSPQVRGTPSTLVRRPGLRAVHPRRCGEHAGLSKWGTGMTGSSPQVRGTHNLRGPVFAHIRFIPAGAGNTANSSCCPTGNAVHPRRCGEHSSCRIAWSIIAGSSPQVRGTRA